MSHSKQQTAIDEIPVLVAQLQSIVNRLEQLFPGRRFTLDGHLVGSLAEVIASYIYDLDLLPSSHECHDGQCRKTGTYVQIKGTQRNRVAMYAEADHLIVLRLANGRADEIYNGPGVGPWAAAGPVAKNGQRSISVRTLRSLAQQVPDGKRLPIVRRFA